MREKTRPPAPRKCRGKIPCGAASEELPRVKREEEQLWPVRFRVHSHPPPHRGKSTNSLEDRDTAGES